MKQNYSNKMIQPEQLSNRGVPKVPNLAMAKNQALAQASERSGIAIQELVTDESFSDNNIFITVKHINSYQNFHFEFECLNS